VKEMSAMATTPLDAPSDLFAGFAGVARRRNPCRAPQSACSLARMDARRLRRHAVCPGGDRAPARVVDHDRRGRSARFAAAGRVRYRRHAGWTDRRPIPSCADWERPRVSLFTAACRFAQSIWQLGIFRFVLGLTLWIRGSVEESEVSLQSRARDDHHRATIKNVFAGRFSPTTVRGIVGAESEVWGRVLDAGGRFSSARSPGSGCPRRAGAVLGLERAVRHAYAWNRSIV
jgi:hypothetical protein